MCVPRYEIPNGDWFFIVKLYNGVFSSSYTIYSNVKLPILSHWVARWRFYMTVYLAIVPTLRRKASLWIAHFGTSLVEYNSKYNNGFQIDKFEYASGRIISILFWLQCVASHWIHLHSYLVCRWDFKQRINYSAGATSSCKPVSLSPSIHQWPEHRPFPLYQHAVPSMLRSLVVLKPNTGEICWQYQPLKSQARLSLYYHGCVIQDNFSFAILLIYQNRCYVESKGNLPILKTYLFSRVSI